MYRVYKGREKQNVYIYVYRSQQNIQLVDDFCISSNSMLTEINQKEKS